MKDIVISSRHIRRELWIFLFCVLAMESLNIYAIIKYNAPWTEAIMSLGFVVVAAVCVYLILWLIRLIVLGIKYGVKAVTKN
jgi:formate hydrogenlyase subunit 4